MKILAVSDEPSPALWDYYKEGCLKDYDLILSCGDLKGEYLSFLVTMARCPVFYVHGNHDTSYDRKPPLGCDCIEDKLVEVNGVKILGLGGSRKYGGGKHQYSEKEMQKRIRRLRFALWRAGGVDIVVTHAPVAGVGDGEDIAHKGFEAFRELLDKYHPQYLLHGHMHLCYGQDKTRQRQYGQTTVINADGKIVLDVEDKIFPKNSHLMIRWHNGAPKLPD
ncbi:MAG: metallophosphoesterase [Oscillospiraceae bacterium]|nr:metallophosphoesterase [Oscillospiraceae bacterium]